jgi:hypothetical protein
MENEGRSHQTHHVEIAAAFCYNAQVFGRQPLCAVTPQK